MRDQERMDLKEILEAVRSAAFTFMDDVEGFLFVQRDAMPKLLLAQVSRVAAALATLRAETSLALSALEDKRR